jgi:hypothetical protein
MALRDRNYDVYVVLGDPTSPPPWVRSTWNEVYNALDPLMRSARGKAAIRTSQYKPGRASRTREEWISFGRIGWNERGNNKWTHMIDGQLTSGVPAEFVDCEIWAPSWTACERDQTAPDVHLAFRKETDFAGSDQRGAALKFSSVFTLAVASDLGSDISTQARQSAEIVASVLGAILRAHCSRPWGYPPDSLYRNNDILDLIYAGLFEPGPLHQEPIPISVLRGTWTSF